MILLYLATAIAAAAPAEPAIQSVTITAERDAEWHSYRHAYRAAAFFATFTWSRPLIQAHMQIRPNKPDIPMDGLRVHLTGEQTSIHLAADPLGRITLPMLKQAYDEDAVLRLNRGKGRYQFSGRYSIKEREDGHYSAAELRSACEQLLSAQRASGYRLRLIGKKCVGVKFIYARDEAAPPVVFRQAPDVERSLPAGPGYPFENNTMGIYNIALYRFSEWPAQGVIDASRRPIAIGTLYE